MALLTLRDIGKIYVSESNVAVGIRGVSLSFDRGEFVAVTGKSGCGKSTLLNVISGMDTYEEGELLIEGNPTSHYLQPEWETYREQYISFIFQDYNIIESFTVLQNVELALMHMEDPRERRRRACELIERVGLTSHLHHKGSRLSGGQKQRTVIARALAKDSPIILADEPTGNLDSATAKEIVALLNEVAMDKLLIVVTHSFEEVEEYATRHIRIYDGSVESDQTLRPAATSKTVEKSPTPPQKGKGDRRKKEIRNGFSLGRVLFTSKPRLSLFLCLLLLIGSFGIFAVTSLCGEADALFREHYMFNDIDGRVVLARRDGTVLTEEELAAIATAQGAGSYLRYDTLLDTGGGLWVTGVGADDFTSLNFPAECTYGEHFGEAQIGRYPTAVDEVLLYLPISLKDDVGSRELLEDRVNISGMTLRVVGVCYFVDNNQPARVLFTEEGFRTATAIHYLYTNSNLNVFISVPGVAGEGAKRFEINRFVPSFTMPEDKIYLDVSDYRSYVSDNPARRNGVTVDLNATYYNYNFGYYSDSTEINFHEVFPEETLTEERPDVFVSPRDSGSCMIISDELLRRISEDVLARSYRQATLFFADDEAAHAAAERISDGVYLAVPADTTYEPEPIEVLGEVLIAFFMGAVWLLSVLFLAFFVNLCSGRALEAFRGDMAIMRSMGIPVRVIRIAMYVRMLTALLPAVLFVIAGAILIYTTPRFNAIFDYLYVWQYVLIFLGMLLLTVRITHRQIRRLFGESVKKSLKGGAEV